MLNLLQYDFIIRGLTAGLILAIVAPVIGIFLVLRRYSLIADTLAHVSLAGIAFGLLVNINPLFTALAATLSSSTIIDRLRQSKKVYGESALAIFLSSSLALAVVLIGLSHGFNTSLFNYLFGSLITVSISDIWTISLLGLAVLFLMSLLSSRLIYISFDEESAKVNGLNINLLNLVFMILTALTISLAIPIVGILLISALLVIPVVTALQFQKTFLPTILIAQAIAVVSVVAGIIISFYFSLPPGGTIVLVSLILFIFVQICRK